MMFMKKKTSQLVQFIEELNDYIVSSPQLRQDTTNKSEQFIQAEIRALIIRYLEKYFEKSGYKDFSKSQQIFLLGRARR